jgi:nicotinamidase/pyrazinamidase
MTPFGRERRNNMKAMILVDIQNDFAPGGALAVTEGDRIVPVVNELQKKFDLVLATQDWHPANHGSFAANHPGKVPGDRIELNGLEQILWPVHCVQNTAGADYVPGLDIRRVARIFYKGTDPGIDSYGAFFDNGRKKETGLDGYLRERGVTDLWIAGLATDYCVKFTALDAVRLGYKTHVVEDACRGVNLVDGDVARALGGMKAAGVEIVRAAEIP